jgi:hypothetical protein
MYPTRWGIISPPSVYRCQRVDKLKELGLGVKTEKIEVEKVTVDKDWLLSI